MSTNCEIRLYPLSLGGTLDYAIICEPALETGEVLDATTQLVEDDSAELDVTSQIIPTEDTNVGKKGVPKDVSLVFRLASIGSTIGDQTLTLTVVGTSGTVQIYQVVVEITQFANCGDNR